MSRLQDILDEVLADPLASARAADRAFGYVGADIPVELALAPGHTACHLPWDADAKTPAADRWLEPGFAPRTRSMLQDWADGRYDRLDFVVFSRGDDSAQRLYYYVCELQRRGIIGGPVPLIFDIAKIDRASSVRHTVASVRRLAARLDIDEQALRDGIERANGRRRLYTDIETRRAGSGRIYEQIARASHFADIDADVRAASFDDSRERPRALLAGSPPPDDRLHTAIEASGWFVSGELHEYAMSCLGPMNDLSADDPAAAIGAHVHGLGIGPRSFSNRAAGVVAAAQRVRADAVVVWLIEEDEALAWHAPAMRAALTTKEIPALVATRRRWDACDGIAEDIDAFLGSLGV